MKPTILRQAETVPEPSSEILSVGDIEQGTIMTPPTPKDVPSSADSTFVVNQLADGINLSDLNLPKPPTNQVYQWEEELPLSIREHPQLAEYAFRWLYPKGREKSGSLDGWQYVSGDLSRAVRRCGIIPALIGGDDSDEMLRSGDLILGWRPIAVNEAHKAYLAKRSYAARHAADEQSESAAQMQKGKGGRFIRQTGEVSSYVGPLQE